MEAERQFTLLLVDDNPTNLMLLVKIIELDLPEVRMLTAASALDGLALAERENIDGAFIDVQMPQMGGLEMCRRLRELPQTAAIPLVLMTAHIAAPEMRAEGLEVGAYDFILQPISNVEMLARIKVMLRLCAAEKKSVANNQQLQQQVDEHADRLRWINGLLMSGNGSLEEIDQRLLYHLVNELPDPGKIDAVDFFDTVATKFPLPWRRTLMKLALLDRIPVVLAEKLSEINDVAAVFDYLGRHHLSVVQTLDGDEYISIKDEAKELLQQRAEEHLSAAERQQVWLQAADWYQQKNAYAAALKCLLFGEQYTAVSQLLGQVGLALLDNGNKRQVLACFEQVDDKQVERCGWLSLFRGLQCLQAQAETASRWLTLAHDHFVAIADERGLVLTLAQQARHALIVEGSFIKCAQKLPKFRALAATQLGVLQPGERLQVVFALGLAELFWGDGFVAVDNILSAAVAEAQHLQMFDRQLELNLLRSVAAVRQGRYRVARTALEQGLNSVSNGDDLLEQRGLQVVACELLHATGDFAGLQQQQLILQRQSQNDDQPIVLNSLLNFYTASLLLAQGDKHNALEIVDIALLADDIATNPHRQSRLLQLRSLLYGLLGQHQLAVVDLHKGLELRQQSGGVICRLENLLYAGASSYILKQYEQAEEYLLTGIEESQEIKEERLRAGFHAWLAVTYRKLGKKKVVTEHIDAFIDQLRRHKVNYFWGMVPELLDDLLPLATIDKSVLAPLLQEQLFCNLGADNGLLPLLKISCLGKFQLQLEQQIFDMSQVGQASRQILTLLVTAPNHSMSLELLMGILWPDSPQSKARSSLDTAHSRLRKGLEECFGKRIRSDYLVLEKGMLSLRNVWIDSTALGETMDKVRYFFQREQNWQAEQALWKMDRLWGGDFLSGYDLDGDLPLLREQLTQLRLEQVVQLARILRQRQQSDEAVNLLQQGFLLDPTHDPIIRQLMKVYRERNDSQAISSLLESYRIALQNENYDLDEIEEFIEILNG